MSALPNYKISRLLYCLAVLLFSKGISIGQLYSISDIDSSLLIDADAVMRNDDTEILVKPNKYILKRKYAVTLLNDEAKDLLRISLDYKKGSSKILAFLVTIYDAEGNLLGFAGEKDLDDYSSFDGYSMITDYRQKYIKLKEKDYPFTIEVEYSTESRNTFLVPEWYPAYHTGTSVVSTTVKVLNETDSEIRVNENKLKEFGVKKLGELHYSANNIQAFHDEVCSPHLYKILPWVEFRPTDFKFEKKDGHISDWESYGHFYQTQLMATQNNMDEVEVINDLEDYVDLTSSRKEIVSQVYKYIQDNTRYISIALDKGGFQPMPTADVHTNKYGDCKALSFYMVSILEAINIKSNYVEVNAGSKKPLSLNKSFASPAPGNHIIVNVPLEKDTMWLDCTSQTSPVGYLGTFTDDRHAVEINQQGSKIVKTPSYSDVSFVKEKAKAELDEDGNLSLTLDFQNSGYYIDRKLGYQRFDEEKMKKEIEEKRYTHLHKTKFVSYTHDLDPENLLINEEIKLTSEAYAELAGNYYMVPLLLTPSSLPRMVSKKERKFPIEFHRKTKEIRSYEFIVPDNFLFEEGVKSDKIESKYGNYSYRIEQKQGGIIAVDSELEIHKGLYDPTEYEDIKSFIEKVKKQQNVQLILKK